MNKYLQHSYYRQSLFLCIALFGLAAEAQAQCRFKVTAEVSTPTVTNGGTVTVSGRIDNVADCGLDTMIISGMQQSWTGAWGSAGSAEVRMPFPGDYTPFSFTYKPYYDPRPADQGSYYPWHHRFKFMIQDKCGEAQADIMLATCVRTTDDKGAQLGCTDSHYPPVEPQYLKAQVDSAPAEYPPTDSLPVSLAHILKPTFGYKADYVAKTAATKKYTPAPPFAPLDELEGTFELRHCRNRPPALTTTVTGNAVTGELRPVIRLKKTGAEAYPKEYLFISHVKQLSPWRSLYRIPVQPNFWHTDRIAAAEKLGDGFRAESDVELQIYDAGSANKVVPFTMSNCFQTQGGGLLSFVETREEYTSNAEMISDLLKFSNQTQRGLSTVEPFRKYFGLFSFYVDLSPNSVFTEAGLRLADEFDLELLVQALTNLPTTSMCRSPFTYFHHAATPGLALGGMAIFETNLVFMNSALDPPEDIVLTKVHEIGHRVGGLHDEYIQYPNDNAPPGTASINCTVDPALPMIHNGVKFGALHKGCRFPNQFRMSRDSIMKDYKFAKFNAVGCASIIFQLKARYGLDAKNEKEFYNECIALGAVVE